MTGNTNGDVFERDRILKERERREKEWKLRTYCGANSKNPRVEKEKIGFAHPQDVILYRLENERK